MQQRTEPHDSLDFFLTPAWATRALCQHILPSLVSWTAGAPLTAWEPACGDGAMARPLAELFDQVHASDVHPYGFGEVHDFLGMVPAPFAADWIITNPPFRLGEQFARQALEGAAARQGVALLVRTAFLESAERYRLYVDHPPAVIAQFVERVPMVKGRLDRAASTATAYCWIVWRRGVSETRFRWIPPCRRQLDRDSDWPAHDMETA